MPSFKRLPLLFAAIAIALVSSLMTLAIHPANAESAGFGPLQVIGNCIDPDASSIHPPPLSDVRVVNVLTVGQCRTASGRPGVHLMVFYQK